MCRKRTGNHAPRNFEGVSLQKLLTPSKSNAALACISSVNGPRDIRCEDNFGISAFTLHQFL